MTRAREELDEVMQLKDQSRLTGVPKSDLSAPVPGEQSAEKEEGKPSRHYFQLEARVSQSAVAGSGTKAGQKLSAANDARKLKEVLDEESAEQPPATKRQNRTRVGDRLARNAPAKGPAPTATSAPGLDRPGEAAGSGLQGGQAEGKPATNSETYAPIVENPFRSPTIDPLSTFAIDVDTASYSNVRRFLNHGQWPPAAAVRIEEMINYFHYDYPDPADGEAFSVNLEVAACPWNAEHRLVRIGLKGKDFKRDVRPPSNLVFLIDVSGSMRDGNKLPLVKRSLEGLVSRMTEDDRIAIVTYASGAQLRLNSTSGQDKETILSAIADLSAGGSTNGEAGIKLAYDTAVAHFYDGGTNRVILCTDGDFNVGQSDDDALVSMITEKAKSGVFLSIFGFGMGNLKDAKLEKLADKGNGHYAYVDSRREAEKVFGEELTGTLYTIAKDVKIQVEFNPAHVGAYRLIGYENRALAARDFNDDTKDAGEIGAGHRVTALYEIIPPGKLPKGANVDPLKYQPAAKARPADDEAMQELLTVKLRYKRPDAQKSTRLEYPLLETRKQKVMPSREFEWASAVAAFGMILRDSKFRGTADFDLVLELVQGSRGRDESGHRREFVELVKKARALKGGSR